MSDSYLRIAERSSRVKADTTEEWAVRACSVLTVLVPLLDDETIDRAKVVDTMEGLLALANPDMLQKSFSNIDNGISAITEAKRMRRR